MQAADIMTRTVVTVQPGAPVIDAIRLMLGQRISGIPVVDNAGKIVGILTEGDLLRRAETGTVQKRPGWMELIRGPGRQAADYVHTHGRKVAEVMTREVVSVAPQTPLDEVVQTMLGKRIKRVPVTVDGQLVGVISRADLLRALGEALNADAQSAAAPGDNALRDQVLAEFVRNDWGREGRVTVIVVDGVVYLEGFVYDERERGALRVAAENVAGVKAVEDHLDYIDPNFGIYGF